MLKRFKDPDPDKENVRNNNIDTNLCNKTYSPKELLAKNVNNKICNNPVNYRRNWHEITGLTEREAEVRFFAAGEVEIKREPSCQAEREIQTGDLDLYAGHEIKEEEELVIGPEVLQQSIPFATDKYYDTVSSQSQTNINNHEIENPKRNVHNENAELQSSTYDGVGIKSESTLIQNQEVKEEIGTHPVVVLQRLPIASDTCTTDKYKDLMVVYINDSLKQFTCNNCKQGFSTLTGLRRHNKKHDLPAKYSCSLCNKVYKYRTRYDNHLAMHCQKDNTDEFASNTKDTWTTKSKRKTIEATVSGRKTLEATVSGRKSLEETVSGRKSLKAIVSGRKSLEATVSGRKTLEETVSGRKSLKAIVSGRKSLEETVSGRKNIQPKQSGLKPKSNPTYICDVCRKDFSSKRSLITHLRSHQIKQTRDSPKNPKTQYCCDDCIQYFPTLSDLKKHNKKHTLAQYLCKSNKVSEHSSSHINKTTQDQKDKHICDICDKEFEFKRDIISHLHSHGTKNTRGKFQCDICQIYFTIKGNLDRHKHLHNDKYYSCEFCAKKFKQKYYLIAHKKSHLGLTQHQCECGKIFYDKSNFKRHKTYFCKKSGTQKKITCNICNKEFARTNQLEYHTLRYHRVCSSEDKVNSPGNYVCDYCNKKFTEKRYLLGHMQIHTGCKPFVCNICHKGYTRKSAQLRHMQIHTGYTFVCKICDKGYARKSSLIQHTFVHTNNESYYYCTLCRNSSSNKCAVKHGTYNTSFAMTKNLSCHLCDKKFGTKLQIKQHNTYFCNEKICNARPISCDVCKKRFSDKQALTRHIDSNHNKVFSCDHCQKSFGTKGKITNHMHFHNKRFVCDICQKPFAQKKILNNHIIGIHTRVKNYSCDKCDKKYLYYSNLRQHKMALCTIPNPVQQSQL